MIELLRDNPLLLLFVIAAIGWPLGRIEIGGVRIGVAAVLFAGLSIGALSPELRLPEIIYVLGLVIFVYTVGLSSGSSFFASLRRKGLRDSLFVAVTLFVAAGLCIVAYALFGFHPPEVPGLFAGSLTNTPALASALEFLKANAPPSLVDSLLAEPVVAYSISYPMGVLGMILAVYVAQRLWKIDYRAEARRAGSLAGTGIQLDNRTIRVTQSQATGKSLSDLVQEQHWNVVFGRIKHGEQLHLVDKHTRLHVGDLLTVVGSPEELARVTAFLGETSQIALDLDRRELDYRRVFVSNPSVAGHTLRSLNLPQQFGAVITRIRRGDIQLVPTGDTVLELGDRVRVLTKRDHLEAIARFLGDSYRAVSEIDVLTLSLGLAVGILLGLAPIPLPGGLSVTLGMAGGPLVVALVLGAIGRTGPFLWNIPYSTSLTLRQFGLVLFLAGVGSRAGYTFFTTLTQGDGLALFAAGAFITVFIALAMLWVGHTLLKIPMGLLTGMLAGMQTQPALLSFAAEQSGDELPNVGYASVYPVATITKIVLAQVLLAWLM
ncbi:MAG: aspartate:alanine exchanger family transporter [Anaerolineales bacterium]